MKIPTQDNISSFLQGYEICHRDTVKAIRRAQQQRKSAAEAAITYTRSGLVHWKLRADNHGFNTMPNSVEVTNAVHIALAVVVGFVIGGIIGGAI